MRLTDLDPAFLKIIDASTRRTDATFAEADGVSFLCPKCFRLNNGPVGTHMIVCWSRSRGVADDVAPGPGRWLLLGSGFHDLTLGPDPPSTQPSVQMLSGCMAHFCVVNGEIVDAGNI